MVKNDGGGYSFPVDCFVELERFLILGSEGGTYYVSEKALTHRSCDALDKCLQVDGQRTIDLIVNVSQNGRAPKNRHAVFALAYIAGTEKGTEVGAAALAAMSKVARYSTDFFQFLDDTTEFRGWGRGLRQAAANWYLDRTPLWVAKQLTKYPQRNGRSHRDVLRLAHPSTEGLMNGVLQYATQREQWFGYESCEPTSEATQFLIAVEEARTADEKKLVRLINDYGLEREHIPTEMLNSKQVWDALLYNLKPWALIRNLGKLTSLGLLNLGSARGKYVRGLLTDPEQIKRARLHPLTTLVAQRQYAQGRGLKGKLTWSPNSKIVAALENAFYLGFDAVEPTGKTHLLCIDVSGSMSWAATAGTDGLLRCTEGAAVMAMVVARTEEEAYICGFAHQIRELGITENDTLQSACDKAVMNNFGGTNAAAPIQWAISNKIDTIDSFALFTDGMSWGGPKHTFQAVQEYRKFSGRATKMAGFQMTASGTSLADPQDAGMMDFVGFDTQAPSVYANFVRD